MVQKDLDYSKGYREWRARTGENLDELMHHIDRVDFMSVMDVALDIKDYAWCAELHEKVYEP